MRDAKTLVITRRQTIDERSQFGHLTGISIFHHTVQSDRKALMLLSVFLLVLQVGRRTNYHVSLEQAWLPKKHVEGEAASPRMSQQCAIVWVSSIIGLNQRDQFSMDEVQEPGSVP